METVIWLTTMIPPSMAFSGIGKENSSTGMINSDAASLSLTTL